MLKNVLVILDGSDGDRVIEDVLINLPNADQVSVKALGIVDRAAICQKRAVPAGAIHMHELATNRAVEQARLALERSMERLVEFGRQKQLRLSVERVDGAARSLISKRWNKQDLIILGREQPGAGTRLLSTRRLMKLLDECPCPVVVATDDPQRYGDTVAIAYDGSAQAYRSLNLFLTLGLAAGKRLEVVTIHEDKDAGETIAHEAVTLCERNGLTAYAYVTQATAQRFPVLRSRLESLRPSCLVMGGLGAGFLRKLLYGSSTADLVKSSAATVFVHR